MTATEAVVANLVTSGYLEKYSTVNKYLIPSNTNKSVPIT